MTYKILSIFLIGLLIPSNCFADEVKYLEQNDKAPYAGFLFTMDATKQYRLLSIENPLLKQENTILKQEKTELSDANDKLAKTVNSEHSLNDFEKLFWFSIGVLGTGFASYGLYKATSH